MSQVSFQPIYPNPYIAGNPIRGKEMFFGRVDEFRFVERLLEGGRKTALIVLYGERRSGKSSILYQILNGELGETFLPIFIDMQIMAGIANDAEFFGRVITDTCKALAKNRLSPEPYTALMQSANSTEVFRKFLEDLKKRFTGRALLLLIDEYEILEVKIAEGSLSPHVLTFLAGLLETEQVSFVFTGSKGLEAHDQALWQGELLRKATSRKISFLTEEDTARLVAQPLHGKVSFPAEVVDEIYALTAGQPFYTQLICQNLVYHLNEVKKREVGSADLQAIVDGILENPPPQLLFNWSELTPERKLALSALAEFSEDHGIYLSADDLCREITRSKVGIDLDANFLNTELAGLFQDEYVLQKGRRYNFRLDLYRRWVRHDHSVWQVKKEIGPKDMARITKETRRKKAKRKKVVSRVEHALVAILALVGAFLAKELIDRIWPKQVKITANAGPFVVWVDGDSLDTTEGQVDSTTFDFNEKELRTGPHVLKVTLLATGETRSDTVIIRGGITEIFKSRTTPVRFQFLESEVMISVTTNAGPFIVFIDGDSVGTTRGHEDSTAFFYHERLSKGLHEVKVILFASGDTEQQTIEIIEGETARAKLRFPESLVTISTDAENFVAELNGNKVIDTKGQAEGWRGAFSVAKGNYKIRITDLKTKEEQEKRLTVSNNSEPVHIDFKRVVVLTLKANTPFQYKYEWRNWDHGKRKDNPMRSSGVSTLVTRRGIEKGVYQFTFKNSKLQKKESNVPIRRDTTITVDFPEPRDRYSLTIITTDPLEAQVLLNDTVVGKTLFYRHFEEGSYQFELVKDGYDILPILIHLKRDTIINVALTPQYGYLILKVVDQQGNSPTEVRVYAKKEGEDKEDFWGDARKLARSAKRLRVGRYTIRAARENNYAKSEVIYVSKNDTTEKTIVLER